MALVIIRNFSILRSERLLKDKNGLLKDFMNNLEVLDSDIFQLFFEFLMNSSFDGLRLNELENK
jgi:hypothetical protein